LERRISELALELADVANSSARAASLLADFARHAAKSVNDDNPRLICIVIAYNNPDSIRERRFREKRPDYSSLV